MGMGNDIKNILSCDENEFCSMVEHSHDMIWTLNKKGNFMFFNKRAEEITGFKLEDWVGKSFVPLLRAEDLPRLIDIFKRTLDGESIQYEVSLFDKDNKLVTLLVDTTPLLSKGEIVGTISFGKDITERKETKEKLS